MAVKWQEPVNLGFEQTFQMMEALELITAWKAN